MTISFVNASTVSATADTATPFADTSYTLPGSAAAGDLLALAIGNKPFSTTPGTPGGYNLEATINSGTTAMGADSGSNRTSAFTRTMVGGDGTAAATWAAQYSPQIGCMIGLRKTNPGAWAVQVTTGFDNNTATTAFSAAGTATLNYAVGDWAVVAIMLSTDAGAHTTPALTIPGCTVADLTAQVNQSTTQGNDGRLYVYTAEITAGTASGAPVFTATGTAGTAGSGHGAAVFLRVTEPAGGTDATATPSVISAIASVGLPVVITDAGVVAFSVGESLVGGDDVLGFGATSDVWATLLPDTVQARARIFAPALWGAPGGLTVTPFSTTRNNLAWNPVLAATSYQVERDGVIIADSVPTNSYADIGLDPATEYFYRVRATR